MRGSRSTKGPSRFGPGGYRNQVRRVMAKWQKYDLVVVDELGYAPLACIGAEFLFPVVSDRAERAALIVTTNPPVPDRKEVVTIYENRGGPTEDTVVSPTLWGAPGFPSARAPQHSRAPTASN